MVEVETAEQEAVEADVKRIYEVGYHIAPTVKEENVEKIVGTIRAAIEKAGGSFIAEGAPSLTRLSYPIATSESGKRIEHDRAHFGWIKFEASKEAAEALEDSLRSTKQILRCIVFRTVREDTRAKMKAPTLREVKRADTIKAAPRRVEEAAGPVSEEELEKAISEITQE